MSITSVDFTVLQAIQGMSCLTLDAFFKFAVKVDLECIVVLVVLLLVWKKTREWGWRVAVAVILEAIIGNVVIKNLVARQRPFVIDTSINLLVDEPVTFSFPSGHAGIGFAIASVIFFSDCKGLWKILALALAGVFAFSRLYLQLHFPSDVLGGACLGWLCGYMAHKNLLIGSDLKYLHPQIF